MMSNSSIILKLESHTSKGSFSEVEVPSDSELETPSKLIRGPKNENADGDTLLEFYQSLVPAHVRVFKREHPDRLPNETDEEFEFRWQFYEYAKKHPLTPQSYFYDIEIQDITLVPIQESSSCFTIIEDDVSQNLDSIKVESACTAEKMMNKSQSADNFGEDHEWEVESIPNSSPFTASAEILKQLSDTCIRLHSTPSIFNFETQSSFPDLVMPELIDKNFTKKGVQMELFERDLETQLSKSMHQSICPVKNRSVVRLSSFRNKLSERIRCRSHSPRRFQTFEEMFHRPTSVPSATWYINNALRKQLASRYTFSGGKAAVTRNFSKSTQRWVSRRLQFGVSAIKINKTIPKIM